MSGGISMRYGCSFPEDSLSFAKNEGNRHKVICNVCKKKKVPVRFGVCQECVDAAISKAIDEAPPKKTLEQLMEAFLMGPNCGTADLTRKAIDLVRQYDKDSV